MRFQTPVQVQIPRVTIKYADSIVFFGSCFTEHMGNKMKELKYQISSSPYGIQYNPMSIFQGITDVLEQNPLDVEDIVHAGGLFFHLNYHGDLSSSSESGLTEKIHELQDLSLKQLRNCRHLLITLGTAWVYQFKETNKIVNNCHKQNDHLFTRRLLEVDEIVSAFQQVVTKHEWMRDKEIHFTISPIRHQRDGFHANQLSKATLLLAVEKIQNLYSKISYFPAYEILLDELRDYRFYANDMLHPSELAIDFIWDKFSQSYLDVTEAEQRRSIEKFNRMKSHRILHPDSEESKFFAKRMKDQCMQLIELYPNLDWSAEKNLYCSH
jgi:hypothetical protein